ncbi:MAG: efflux RND transporter periplasmic adaptor subunit [Candidatus Omnitrophica bacterium]|nr:efflux RND transporter periplasmic adaptor subunit [Candidatus Omnitrophota bacterium]MDD5352269.1 efflux RND transporter periplasmic adaptor subunit [Candidatus Omnitrophota bacterium]MDD5549867.1 efflux RND transporter periplasmic adaptor subunit [Candidatus Omnitrophota bacterium]
MNYKIKNYGIVLLLILFAAPLFGCQVKEKAKVENLQSIPVKVMKVQRMDLYNKLEYTGDIKAEDEVDVYPKVSGKIIEKVKQDGESVNKGDVIAYIDRDEVGLKFEKAPVESPLTGTVGRIYVDIGSNVSSQTPVALVVNMDRVKINLDIPEIYLPKIFLGQEAKVATDAYPEKEFIGKVTKVSPVVNLENRAAPIEITIDNPEHFLKSGMFVKVTLALEKHTNVPQIIKEAIIGREPDTYVYLVENNKAKMRKVSLGIHDGPFYEVTQGLEEGEMVVIMGQQRLYEDAPTVVEIGNGQGETR